MVALAITKQVLQNGPRDYIATYSWIGDGSSTIDNYVAADPTSTGDMGFVFTGQTLYPGTHLKIWQLRYNLAAGYSLELIWDATTPQAAWALYGFGKQKFKEQGGLYVPQSNGAPITGATGKILFTCSASGNVVPSDATGTVQMWLKKDIAQ